MKILELFSGLGGFAEALKTTPFEPTLGFDISPHVVEAYRLNHDGACTQKNIETLKPKDVADFDWWWMSPPCKPHTRRGAQNDLADHRSGPFQHVCGLIESEQPAFITLENVEGFVGSDAHERLMSAVSNYRSVHTQVICPTELGVPNKRPRFYLVASRDETLADIVLPKNERTLDSFIDDDYSDNLLVPERIVEKYGNVMHRAEVDGYATCFTSGYAKSWVYSGSFLTEGDRLRQFSTTEIASLLGFSVFKWPESFSQRQRYKYLGNSLSIPVVRAIIKPIIDCIG